MSSASQTPVEWGWFAPCCEDDFEFLGVPDPALASTPEHVRDVVLAAEAAGFKNILLPSGFNTGADAWVMACALASQTSTISLLPAIRVGEHHPPMFARAAANLDHILNGRLNINIISSPLAGLPPESSAVRYERTQEFMQVVKAFWQKPHVEYSGRYFQYNLKSDIPRPVRPSGPPLYFGGASPQAKEAAAAQADVYLFWGDTVEMIGSGIQEMQSLAARHHQLLLFGLRIHVIARESEEAAKDAAQRLISKLNDETGDAINSARWTRVQRARRDRTNSWRRVNGPKSFYGRASGAGVLVAARRLWAATIRWKPSCVLTSRRESGLSFCRVIRTATKHCVSASTCCRALRKLHARVCCRTSRKAENNQSSTRKEFIMALPQVGSQLIVFGKKYNVENDIEAILDSLQKAGYAAG
jgi:alkanesulfonate monooxygenase